MNNTKTTKRALLSSVMAMLICVAMLIGTTFAWFTDSASTAVNKIQAGTLDIALEMKDNGGNWVTAEGKTLQFKVNGQIPADGTQILWEPGCTYELPELRIVNNGNLALKYKIIITGINGSAKLNKAIEWTINTDDTEFDFNTYHSLAAKGNTNDSDKLTISGHMKEDAGNEYQGLSIDGIGITVVATQDTVEYDSTVNDYDEDANEASVWDGNTDSAGLAANTNDGTKTVAIKTANQFAAFAAAVNSGNSYAGYTVNLMAPIDLNNIEWTPIGQTGAGNGTFTGVFDGHGLTIKNLKITETDTSKNHAAGLFGWLNTATVKNVNVVNADVSAHSYTGVIAGYVECIPNAYILNCHVSNATVSSTSVSTNGGDDGLGDGAKCGGIAGFAANAGTLVKDCSVKDSTISARRDAGQVVGIAKIANVENCSATNVSVTGNDTGAADSERGTYIREEIIGRVTG